MAYDATEVLRALELPAITLPNWRGRPRRYVGRILSIEEWAPFEPRVAELGMGSLSTPEVNLLFREILTEMLLPADKIMRLPPAVFAEAIQDFLACQARAMPRMMRITNTDNGSGDGDQGESPSDT